MNEQQPHQPGSTTEAQPARVRRVARPQSDGRADDVTLSGPARVPGSATTNGTAAMATGAATTTVITPDGGPKPAPMPGGRGRAGGVVRVARTVDFDLEEHLATEHHRTQGRIRGWLYQREEEGHHAARPWYQVLCLTGVDYFSTLGYQPGIAYLAAGLLSPVATLVLVLFTLVGALPVYRRVAAESPHGQGSIGMLERLLPRWRGKLFVLVLLGFAATDFIITITLSAADATAHVVENPFFPETLRHNTGVDITLTVLLIGVLGGVFLKGFKEAIGVAVVLVIIFLGLNAIVITRAFADLAAEPGHFNDWLHDLRLDRGNNPLTWLGVSLLLFPKLALGMSGFETGVAVMPVVKGRPGDTERHPDGRIENTKKLLAAAALVMSVYLITSSVATTILIPPEAYAEGGDANGRALAFLAHEDLGDIFGTVYDVSTIAILWFAGASAMAGLLNLVPRYLPGYGMAPRWASAQRPLVLVFTIIAFTVTVLFKADVNAQGAAYATGVLVLMTSGSIAVLISLARKRSKLTLPFTLIMLAFFYITIQNVHERPSGLIIASLFIIAIVVTSIVSRALRATELRFGHVVLDRTANQMIGAAVKDGSLRLVTHDPKRGKRPEDYARELEEARRRHHIPAEVPVLLLEVRAGDPSVFADDLLVTAETIGECKLLRCTAPAIANAITALAIAIHGRYGCNVDLYMRWTPIDSVLDAVGEGVEFLLWGGGDMARLVELEVRREGRKEVVNVHAV